MVAKQTPNPKKKSKDKKMSENHLQVVSTETILLNNTDQNIRNDVMEKPTTIGTLLRQARESKGHSLKKISQHTKINLTLLEALEEDRLDKLPSRAYVLGFVRAYAGLVDVDTKTAFEALNNSYTNAASVKTKKPKMDLMRAETSSDRVNYAAMILAGLVFAMVGGVAVFLNQKKEVVEVKEEVFTEKLTETTPLKMEPNVFNTAKEKVDETKTASQNNMKAQATAPKETQPEKQVPTTAEKTNTTLTADQQGASKTVTPNYTGSVSPEILNTKGEMTKVLEQEIQEQIMQVSQPTLATQMDTNQRQILLAPKQPDLPKIDTSLTTPTIAESTNKTTVVAKPTPVSITIVNADKPTNPQTATATQTVNAKEEKLVVDPKKLKTETTPPVKTEGPQIEFKKITEPTYSVKEEGTKEALKQFVPPNMQSAVIRDKQNIFITAVDGDTWITYKKDQDAIKRFTLTKDRSILIRGDEVRVFLGNANVTRVFLNNKLLDVTSKNGVKSLVFPQEKAVNYSVPLFIYKDGTMVTSEEFLKNSGVQQ